LVRLNGIDAETKLLGALILREGAIFELPASFVPEAITSPVGRRVFAAVRAVSEKHRRPELDVVAMEAGLSATEVEWLREVVMQGSLADPTPFAEKLLDGYRRRTLRGMIDEALEQLRSSTDTAEVVGQLMTRLLGLDTEGRPDLADFANSVLASLAAVDDALSGRSKALRTGFKRIDELVLIRPGNLLILAARPGVGKSTLALNIADNIASGGKRVLFHSLEMDDHELVLRVLSRATDIEADKLFAEKGLSPEERDKLVRHADDRTRKLGRGLLMNTTHHTLGSICRLTEKEHRRSPLALVVVDYLQLVEVDLGKNASAEQRIATVSRTLKLLAQRLRVPVLAVAQVNREHERRQMPGRRAEDKAGAETPGLPPPQLHDLRGSGAIENDANVVMFLHNPFAQSTKLWERDHGPFLLTVAKQRAGRRGYVKLHADLAHARFMEVA